jgi:hypothetical protein
MLPGSTARVISVPSDGATGGIVQIQFCLRQLRLRLFKAGFGLGNILRAVTGAVLA